MRCGTTVLRPCGADWEGHPAGILAQVSPPPPRPQSLGIAKETALNSAPWGHVVVGGEGCCFGLVQTGRGGMELVPKARLFACVKHLWAP